MKDWLFQISSILFLLISTSCVARSADIELEYPMHNDPKIKSPARTPYFSPKLKPLWLKALNHSESDLQQQMAHTIAKAHQLGMNGLAGSSEVIQALERRLGPENDIVVRRAAARALVVLDSKSSAKLLFDRLESDGLDMAQIVEPALANWDYKPARARWLKRTRDNSVSRKRLVLAIRGLGTVQETKAAARLLELAMDRSESTTVRLAAARSLADVQSEGLVENSRALATDSSPNKISDRLVAASMLASHQSDEAKELLVKLALDPEPAVATIALGRLLAVAPLLIVPHSETLTKSPDGKVRLLVARALRQKETPDAVEQLGKLLDDKHPDVRNYVRRALVELAANKQLTSIAIAEGMRALNNDSWRGKEQSIILLVLLDHKPAAKPLIPLLDFDRREVFEAAAWGLRRLAVPETLEAMYDKLRRETNIREQGLAIAPSSDHQITQLIQAFGEMKYARAASLLRRKYIPKTFAPMELSPFGKDSRTAAIWSLGHLFEGKNDRDLSDKLAGRLNDLSTFLSEYEEVRAMSAVSLGRINATENLSDLQRFQEPMSSLVGYSCAWAIHRMTGKAIPELKPVRIWHSNWVLQPLED